MSLTDEAIKGFIDGHYIAAAFLMGCFFGAFPGFAIKRVKAMWAAWRDRRGK